MAIWDNSRIHRSVEVKTLLWEHRPRLEARRFPSYAPDLDPDEQVWSGLQFQRLPNWCPKTEDEIRAEVERVRRLMQAHPSWSPSSSGIRSCRSLRSRKRAGHPEPFMATGIKPVPCEAERFARRLAIPSSTAPRASITNDPMIGGGAGPAFSHGGRHVWGMPLSVVPWPGQISAQSKTRGTPATNQTSPSAMKKVPTTDLDSEGVR